MPSTAFSLPAPTIFVVDDDASFRNAIERLLRAGGYAVQVFASATEFMQSARGNAPGCVLLDLHMPGPSGLDLQSALVQSENPLPIGRNIVDRSRGIWGLDAGSRGPLVRRAGTC